VPHHEQPLTAQTPIGTWLDDPEGARLLEELLAKTGLSAEVLTPARQIPLGQLVTASQGQITQDVIDDLVRAANGGVIPEASADDDVWHETVVPGRFTGRTVIVTGAGSGIGRATAERVVGEGGQVIAVDIATARLEQLAADLGRDDVVIVTADITEQEDVERIVAAAGDRIDALANIAGIADDMTPLHEVSDGMWSRVMAVNVDGMFRLSRAVLPAMLKAQRGSIVNVASEAALRGSAAGFAYTTSKHAVIGMTRSSAFMYGPQGIRVNAVAPGGVATGMEARFASDLGQRRLGPFLQLIPPIAVASQLAATITFLLSDDATNINGVILPADGGWSVQ
jgi:NAD(P)-dependent dehydrogenase (short-subunit alcohol dehydrogenase family)